MKKLFPDNFRQCSTKVILRDIAVLSWHSSVCCATTDEDTFSMSDVHIE